MPGCTRPPFWGGCPHCQMHYTRLRRNGSLEARRPLRVTRGTCIADGCEDLDEGAAGYCPKHATRVRRHGAPETVLPASAPKGAKHHNWAGDNADYYTAHKRMSEESPARNYLCVVCSTTAAEWAYDHLDHDQQTTNGLVFSLKASHYQPMCKSCHRRFDSELRRKPA